MNLTLARLAAEISSFGKNLLSLSTPEQDFAFWVALVLFLALFVVGFLTVYPIHIFVIHLQLFFTFFAARSRWEVNTDQGPI